MTAADDPTTPPIPISPRRSSIGAPTNHQPSPSSTSTTTAATSASSSSSSSSFSSSLVDFELVSIKPPCYTSLRDILASPAAAVQSPKAPCYAAHSGYEISIRNHLVKQAAWAYLQPMSTSPESDRSTVFHGLWTQFSGSLLRLIATAFDCLLCSIHVKR